MCHLCEELPPIISETEVTTPAGHAATLTQDTECFFIESKPLDYFAQGDSPEDAMWRFDEGLALTQALRAQRAV